MLCGDEDGWGRRGEQRRRRAGEMYGYGQRVVSNNRVSVRNKKSSTLLILVELSCSGLNKPGEMLCGDEDGR